LASIAIALLFILAAVFWLAVAQDSMRAVLDAFTAEQQRVYNSSQYGAYLTGGSCENVDDQRRLYRLFPL
jgi:hypothetical protein